MTEIKLIALDLDGTLLTHDKKISERNLAALKAAHAQGVKIVLTTGRPLKAMTTGFESIDIVLDYVDKGVALVELAKKLGLEMEQVMAFGDNLNDLHMMQVAGQPIAPENARPEILALAKQVIGHHAAGSVMTYMEGL